jgi:hypothetical protein
VDAVRYAMTDGVGGMDEGLDPEEITSSGLAEAFVFVKWGVVSQHSHPVARHGENATRVGQPLEEFAPKGWASPGWRPLNASSTPTL